MLILKFLFLIIEPILTFFWSILIFLLIVLYAFLSPICFDASKKPEYEWLTKPIFETEIDLFLFKWSGGNYALEAAGHKFLPSSLTAYTQDPENWMFTDDFAEERQRLCKLHAGKVVGIIPKGTRLKVTQIKKSILTGDVKGYFAHLENDQFSKYFVDIHSFLELNSLHMEPKVREGFLKPITQPQISQHASLKQTTISVFPSA
jgi:hypothetical protein